MKASMKQIITTSLKQLLNHRRLLTVLIILLLLTIGAVIYIAMTIEARDDLRIITHYTAYGITHFYRDSWLYLLSFIVFVISTAVLTIGISLKLLLQEREEFALLFSWIGITTVCLTLVTYTHIIGLM